MHDCESLKDTPRALELPVSLLKLNISHPHRLVWLPAHPPLESLPCARNVAQHLLHVDILIPQLVHSWHDRHCPIQQIARMVDIPLFHLGLDVPHPQLHIRRFRVQGPLKYRPRSPVLFLLELPGRVPHPVAHIEPIAAHIVLELLALAALKFMELFEVSESAVSVARGPVSCLSTASRRSCFCGYLLRRRCLVLDPGRAA